MGLRVELRVNALEIHSDSLEKNREGIPLQRACYISSSFVSRFLAEYSPRWNLVPLSRCSSLQFPLNDDDETRTKRTRASEEDVDEVLPEVM